MLCEAGCHLNLTVQLVVAGLVVVLLDELLQWDKFFLVVRHILSM